MQLYHINFEITDDESEIETKSTLVFNMLRIDYEYEVPIESKFYQK